MKQTLILTLTILCLGCSHELPEGYTLVKCGNKYGLEHSSFALGHSVNTWYFKFSAIQFAHNWNKVWGPRRDEYAECGPWVPVEEKP